jgi:ferredoxin-thioredoxin reductase catalytic subunit
VSGDAKAFDEARSEIETVCREYVEGSPYVFYPDPKRVEGILDGLAKRKIRLGEYYCPCRLVTGDTEKDKGIICPCEYHAEEIERQGYCHCHLFASPDFAEN